MQAGAALWPPAIPESQGDRREVLALAFAPDGSRAVASIGQVGTCKTLWMLDAATGKALFEVNRGHASSANALAFTPDGKLIAAATGGPAESVSESSAMTRVEWRYDSVSDCSVTFYAAADGTVVRRLTGYQQPVMAVAFSADGKRVLSAERGGALLLHEVSTGNLIRRMALRSYDVAGLAFLPDGRRALVAGGNTYEGHGVLLLVDTESGEQLRAFDAPEPE